MEKNAKTSHLLFDEAPLLVRPELAVRIGLNESIVLQQVHYWLENKRKSTKERDLATERTYQEGRFWTYDTYEQWQEQFPFWSVSTIERIFKKLEKSGVLISDTFNTWKADRTKWYTIDYDALDSYKKEKRKSKHDNKVELSTTNDEDVANEDQYVKLRDCIPTQSLNLTKLIPTHSVKLTGAIPQVDVTIPSSWGEQSVNLRGAIPKSSSKSSTKTSDQDFYSSSSNEEEGKNEFTKEEEEDLKSRLIYLGSEISKSKLMVTNKQIDDTLKLIVERCIVDFDAVDVECAIDHYKNECTKRSIGNPPLFFVNGFEIVMSRRRTTTIGNSLIDSNMAYKLALEENRVVDHVPFYNWLVERD